MAKAYWIAHITINNLDGFMEYPPESTKVVNSHGGRFLSRGGKSQLLEGTIRDRHVIVEFDSFDAALACYNSPEYAVARALRKRYSDGDIVIIEGLEQI